MSDTGILLSFPSGDRIDSSRETSSLEEINLDGDLDPGLVDEEHKKNILDKIERLRHLVEQGRVGELVLIGQDPVTGYYITEVCLDPAMNRTELFGFMGVLETVKLELSEHAAMAPVMTLSGTVLDPYDLLEEE